MIEASSDGLRVSGPMLFAGATELLALGRSFLSSSGKGNAILLGLSADEETDSTTSGLVLLSPQAIKVKAIAIEKRTTKAEWVKVFIIVFQPPKIFLV